MRVPLTSCLVAISMVSVQAHVPDLQPLNQEFMGAITFKMDRHGRLVMDHFDQGQRFRQDLVRIEELDPEAVSYSAEEHGIALKCLPDKAQCFSKEIFKLDVVRLTSRVTLAAPATDPEGARTMLLLRDLIRSAQQVNDQAEAETPGRPLRMNQR